MRRGFCSLRSSLFLYLAAWLPKEALGRKESHVAPPHFQAPSCCSPGPLVCRLMTGRWHYKFPLPPDERCPFRRASPVIHAPARRLSKAVIPFYPLLPPCSCSLADFPGRLMMGGHVGWSADRRPRNGAKGVLGRASYLELLALQPFILCPLTGVARNGSPENRDGDACQRWTPAQPRHSVTFDLGSKVTAWREV